MIRLPREDVVRQLKREATRGIPPGRHTSLTERQQRWAERLLLWIGRLIGGRKERQ